MKKSDFVETAIIGVLVVCLTVISIKIINK